MPQSPPSPDCLLVSSADVNRALEMPLCLSTVEDAFLQSADPGAIPPVTSGMHSDDGTFHVKAALSTRRPDVPRRFAAKVNANFPKNPTRNGFPTIQGVLLLFDADAGVPLALMDSASITVRRTAAATGVAARYLARVDADSVAMIGCGAQSLAHLEALCAVRPVRRVRAFDANPAAANRLATLVPEQLGIRVTVASSLNSAVAGADIVVTATTSTAAFLGIAHVSPGCFIAAVGADNPGKSEIDPALMAAAVVVTDSTAQCASMGDLHHAVAAGAMSVDAVRSELAAVVSDPACGRRDGEEIIVFDSTGLAFQDVGVAALVFDVLRDQPGIPRFRFAAVG